MSRTLSIPVALALLVAPPLAAGQTRLSLADAVSRAQSGNLDAQASEAAERQAAQHVTEARAGYLPSVEVSETWQRGTHPVFVFSSLLAQRRFAGSNFAIDALNHPDATANLRTALAIDQPVFDPSTRTAVRAATLGHDVATASRSRVAQDLAVDVSRAYGAALSAGAERSAAAAAVETATADLALARDRRDVGLVTDADVLQLEVHLAQTREQEIRAEAEVPIARARLNQAIGQPLDTVLELEEVPEPAPRTDTPVSVLEAAALTSRPDVRIAALQEQLAEVSVDAARAAFLPRVAVQGGWEGNGGAWDTRASSWTVGVTGQINLFRGFADRARLAAARAQHTQRSLEREKAEIAAQLDVRVALARLDAARAAEAVGRAAVAQARESHRIVRDRYEAGLIDVSGLIRAAEAVQQALVRQTAARVGLVLAAAELNRAVGKS